MKTQKYKVRLTEIQRVELQKILESNTHTKKQKMRADVLLEMDLFYYFDSRYRPQDIVASRCGVSTTTVYNISRKYAEEGLNAAISRKFRKKPPVAPIITDEIKVSLITLARSAPPEGSSRWTLRLLEKKAVELGIIERISDTTISRLLKKHQISLK